MNIDAVILSLPFGFVALAGLILSAALAWWIYSLRSPSLKENQVIRQNSFDRNIATFVTLGVALGGFLSGWFIGWQNVIILAILFVILGIPQYIAAAIYNNAVTRNNLAIAERRIHAAESVAKLERERMGALE